MSDKAMHISFIFQTKRPQNNSSIYLEFKPKRLFFNNLPFSQK